VPISAPRKPSSRTQYSSSAAAASGAWSGTWARATNRSGWTFTIEARCSFTERLIFLAISRGSQYMKWNGEGEIACTSMPILSMSRSRCSTDVRQAHTFSICLRLVARDRSFEKRCEGSRSGVSRCLTISSADGWWTWQWMSTQKWRRFPPAAPRAPPRAAAPGQVKSIQFSLSRPASFAVSPQRRFAAASSCASLVGVESWHL